MHNRPPIAKDGVVWSLCVCVCVCVCVSVTFVIPAKTAQSIEMPIEGKTRVGRRNHILDGGRDSHIKRQFGVCPDH